MKKLIILFSLVVLALVLYFLSDNPENRSGNLGNRSENLETESPEPSFPLSIPAYIKKTYTGEDFRVGKVIADNSAYTQHYITYKSEGLNISGIMNVPKGNGPFPVIITNHGYIDPSIYTNGRGLRREHDYLVRKGYVVVHPDYRNHAQSDKTENADLQFRYGYIEDVINVVSAIKKSDLTYIDKDRVGMLGHSMGGGITLNSIIIKPDLVKAAVLFAPVSADQVDNFNKWIARRPEVAQFILNTFGNWNENPGFWKGISAINYLDRIEIPVMIHHGTRDESVPLEWSEKLQAGLAQAEVDSTLHIYQGEGHEFSSDWNLVMERTVAFFDQHLKK